MGDEFAADEELSETTTESNESQEVESNDDKCKEEAIRLALEYNFVTDVTSMVVEEEDEYVSKGTVSVSKEIVYGNDDQDYYDPGNSFFGHSSAHSSGTFPRTSSFLANSFVVSRSDDYSDDYYDIQSLDGRTDSIYYTTTSRPATSTTSSTTTTTF